MIPFGEWRPDLPDFQHPGATEAKNVIPDFNSYRPFPAKHTVSPVSGAPATDVTGAFYSETPPTSLATLGEGFVYAGTATKLHRYWLDSTTVGSDTWSDVTRTTVGDYTSGQWQFAKFGTRIIAVNGADGPQSYVEGSSTDFAALAGSPPTGARFVSVVRDFVNMAPNGNTQHWSAINDPEDWTPSATTQSDTQTVPEGGIITGLAGGEYGLTFMENAIYRQTYIGSPLIFQFDRITSLIGMSNGNGLAQHEDMVFFHSGEGFFVIKGGQQIIPIGEGKVDRYVINETQATSTITGAIDPFRKIYVARLTRTADDFEQHELLIYHWPSGRWSRVELAVEADEFTFLFSAKSDKNSGVIDFMSLGAFEGSTFYDFSTFHSGNMAAVLETTEAQIFPGRRAFVQGVRPIIDGGTDANITVALAARAAPNDTVSFGSAVAMNSSGLSPQRSSGRFHRAQVNVAAGASWTHAQGIDVEAVPEGSR
jgi:hypothetical protein